jgi:hypothetical protein
MRNRYFYFTFPYGHLMNGYWFKLSSSTKKGAYNMVNKTFANADKLKCFDPKENNNIDLDQWLDQNCGYYCLDIRLEDT